MKRKAAQVVQEEGETASTASEPVPITTLRYRQMQKTVEIMQKKITGLESKLNERGLTRENVVDEIAKRQVGSNQDPIRCAVLDYKSDRPKYPGRGDIHPMTFIEDLDAYIKRLPNQSFIIDDIVACLGGEARNWARIYRDRWRTALDFKGDFLQTYWGETEQSTLRRKIICERWDSTKTRSMLEYFLMYTGQAKMLTTPPPEEQLVNDLIRHFPREIQYMWVLRKGTTIIEAAEFLRRFDTIENQIGESNLRTSTSVSDSVTKQRMRESGKDSNQLVNRYKKRKEINFIAEEPSVVENENNELQSLN